ncbi:Fungalysin/Thermolysin Extracellular metalloproteinase 5 [Boothiomyces macroporosus]|uniref:Extracellular metalloproteinase n=1 Tax=Boothiomyces macroporosus TaxID=261099 RepID=A0AAD5UPQ8_9FUNG|nr:Fungalysin/Thermolysin Extracellular metalloproteinase 5 [Boothiomyces macroporosus]
MLKSLLFVLSVTAVPFTRNLEGFGPNVQTHTIEFPFSILSKTSEISLTDAQSTALESFKQKLPVDLKISSAYQTKHNKVYHVYVQQLFEGLEVANGVGACHLDRYGNVISMSHSFYVKPVSLLTFQQDQFALEPKLNEKDALLTLVNYIGLPYKNVNQNSFTSPVTLKVDHYPEVPAVLKMIQNDGSLQLVWDLVFDIESNWFNAHVDAETGKVVSLVDWVSHATFNVYPLGTNDPDSGPRQLLVDPEHPVASPLGWNTQRKGKKDTVSPYTLGNNVYAQSNPDGGESWRSNHRPKAAKGQVFDYPIDLEEDPDTYTDGAIVNLFYWNNIIHDLFYVYGFTEEAGNFQDNNLGRGGKGNDAVVANAQDGSGLNNANFATPPDGQRPRMRMYVWTQTQPRRDGDLESGIIIHEYAHGISTRLTGGPANSNCLGWGEAGGMGEGWGDIFATILRTTPNTTRNDDFGMGEYSNGVGIRPYKYSTDQKTNPQTYSYIRKPAYWGVHPKGSVWAATLYEVFWNLVDKHGYEPGWFDVPSSTDDEYPTAGNKLMLRLIVDGLKLQPCSPSFVDARDAIILADKINTGGSNLCEIYKGFAKRGLGVKARSGGAEDFSVPEECQ